MTIITITMNKERFISELRSTKHYINQFCNYTNRIGWNDMGGISVRLEILALKRPKVIFCR